MAGRWCEAVPTDPEGSAFYAESVTRACLMGIAAVLGGILLSSEYAHWKASSQALGTARHPPYPEVILVLGAKNRGDRANFLNRYRVRAALRSQTRDGDSTMVFCGGAVGGVSTEADLMARYACDELGYHGPYELECASSTTWENVLNAVPYLERAAVIKIVSNSLHAQRAREYLWQARPDLAQRLTRGTDYRFGEIVLLKPLLTYLSYRQRWRRRRPSENTQQTPRSG